MDELIEKVKNTLEMRNICIPDDYDIINILFIYNHSYFIYYLYYIQSILIS